MKTSRKASVFRAFTVYSIDTAAAVIGWLYGFGMSVHNWYVLIGILFGWRFLFHVIQLAFIYDDAMKYAQRSGVFDEQDEWTSYIYEYVTFNQLDTVTTRQLLTECLHFGRFQLGQNRADALRVANIMRSLGWIKKRSCTGSREWFYAKPVEHVEAGPTGVQS